MSVTSDLLSSLAKKSANHEFYTPIPKGYKAGKTKYVIITGTVMSGLGKGIFSSSLGKLLQDRGLSCSPIKFDGYLNVDAGTLNPFRHGEVFVLYDGMECDMDLGTYERMLEKDLLSINYLTGGKIFTQILSRERKGKYLGRDVQIIPHVTGDIKRFLRENAMKTKADVVLMEVGGTVGDLENGYFIEAMRQLAYEEGRENVCFVTLTYVLEPNFLGEQKSKGAQLGIRRLMETGIQPDFIACRATNPVTEKVMEKISIYSNVPQERVFSVHDLESIYFIPELLKNEGVDKAIMERLSLKSKKSSPQNEWNQFVNNIRKPKHKITIGVTGKYTEIRDSYASILKALEHAGAKYKTKVIVEWIETTNLKESELPKIMKGLSGIIVPGGFGKRGIEGKILCAKYAREKKIPYLGLCLGFQIGVIEFARNVCKIKDATSTEFDSKTKNPVICVLPEQLKIEGLGGNMRLGGQNVEVKKNTLAYSLYDNKTRVRERFRHRYECNPLYIKPLEEKGIIFSGKAPKQPIMQIFELPKSMHPFMLGTQYHAEFTSKSLKPNPLFDGFVAAALKNLKR